MKRDLDILAPAKTAIARWGRIEMLINNAGMFGSSPIGAVKAEFFKDMMLTNVIGPALLVREC